eukprot:scaffold237707_cov39-Tisochrysis_lutea.AAC.2
MQATQRGVVARAFHIQTDRARHDAFPPLTPANSGLSSSRIRLTCLSKTAHWTVETRAPYAPSLGRYSWLLVSRSQDSSATLAQAYKHAPTKARISPSQG